MTTPSEPGFYWVRRKETDRVRGGDWEPAEIDEIGCVYVLNRARVFHGSEFEWGPRIEPPPKPKPDICGCWRHDGPNARHHPCRADCPPADEPSR